LVPFEHVPQPFCVGGSSQSVTLQVPADVQEFCELLPEMLQEECDVQELRVL
jgi:hypothetical protein